MIGTHNSMTYLKPRTWWMRLVNRWAKCQDKTLEEQLKSYKCFDFRVFYYRGGWCFAHGFCEYTSTTIYQALNKIEELKGNHTIYVRLILEKSDDMSSAFVNLCKKLETQYSNINFFGGNRKSDWKKLYTFSTGISDNKVHQYVSSMQPCSKLITPREYAKKHNEENLKKLSKDIDLFDFI